MADTHENWLRDIKRCFSKATENSQWNPLLETQVKCNAPRAGVDTANNGRLEHYRFYVWFS